jgi:putative FmdB family regulatory protein
VPTYQYRCTECGEDLEVVQKFSDEPLTVCPACQGALRKVFSPVGIVFKGSGFYRTDSRNGSGDAAKKDKEPAGTKSADSSSSSSSDSGKSAANGSSSGSSGSDSSSSGSSGSSSSGKPEKSSSSTTPAASKAG